MKHASRAQIVALVVGTIVLVVYAVFYLVIIPKYFNTDRDEYRQLASYIFGLCMTICTFIIPNIGHTLDTLVDIKK